MLTVLLFFCTTAVYARNTRREIADSVIRLHILANSDSEADQALKIRIRDKILSEYKNVLSGNDSIEKTRQLIYDEMSNIKRTAECEAAAAGYNYTVNVYMAKDFFPTKHYADVTLPAGKYEALRVEIGKAEGKNWWCVMFPPLCYADTSDSAAAAKSRERLKSVLSGESYGLITKKTPDVQVKLKVVEIWSEIKEKI